jgi:hypothetical protein
MTCPENANNENSHAAEMILNGNSAENHANGGDSNAGSSSDNPTGSAVAAVAIIGMGESSRI